MAQCRAWRDDELAIQDLRDLVIRHSAKILVRSTAAGGRTAHDWSLAPPTHGDGWRRPKASRGRPRCQSANHRLPVYAAVRCLLPLLIPRACVLLPGHWIHPSTAGRPLRVALADLLDGRHERAQGGNDASGGEVHKPHRTVSATESRLIGSTSRSLDIPWTVNGRCLTLWQKRRRVHPAPVPLFEDVERVILGHAR